MGVLFMSKPWVTKSGTEKCFGIVSGRVLFDATMKKQWTKNFCSVVVKYHQSKRSFVHCTARGDTSALRTMYCLEPKDIVLCVGTITISHKKNRLGDEITQYWMDCDIVIPSDLIGLMAEMCASPTIAEILKLDYPEDFGEGFGELVAERRAERIQKIMRYARIRREREEDEQKKDGTNSSIANIGGGTNF